MELNLLDRLVNFFRGGFVLAFHEISAAKFLELIECVGPAEVVPLSELVDRSKADKSTSGLFAITVDDAVGESSRALSEVCLARAWPITFYVPTRYLDSGEGMAWQWWRRLKPHLPHRKLELKSGTLDLSHPQAVEQLSKRMEQEWHTQPLESYLGRTMELVEFLVREEIAALPDLLPPSPLTWPEVERYSKTELIRFESHGVSHTALSALTEEELLYEMRRSQDVIAEHTGRPCRHLAYPFGSPQCVRPEVVSLAPKFYDSAATLMLGHVDGANPWMLPRIPFYAENSRWLAKAKLLLKCGSWRSMRWPEPDKEVTALPSRNRS